MEAQLWSAGLVGKPEMKSKSSSMPLNRGRLSQLFEEVGSEERLRLILRDFYRRMKADILVGFFFEGVEPDEVAERQLHFLMKAMGQISTYEGKLPAQAHQHLPPILPGHFDRRLRLLEDVLREHGIAEAMIQRWIQFENTFRDPIVSQ